MFLIILWSSLTCQNKKDTLVDPVESSFKDLTFSRTNESGHYGSNKYFQKNRICRIFRSFPIILDPLENNIKIKML